MKVIDLVEKYGLEAVVMASPDREIVTGYCGDLLSVVMSEEFIELEKEESHD